MKQSSTRRVWTLKKDSSYKLVIWFKDKSHSSTFYSFDWQHRYARIYDPALGLRRLQHQVVKYGIRAGFAIIYSIRTNKAIHKYYEGDAISLETNH